MDPISFVDISPIRYHQSIGFIDLAMDASISCSVSLLTVISGFCWLEKGRNMTSVHKHLKFDPLLQLRPKIGTVRARNRTRRSLSANSFTQHGILQTRISGYFVIRHMYYYLHTNATGKLRRLFVYFFNGLRMMPP